MLPRLSAEESLNAVTRVAFGSGTMASDDQRAVQQRWSEAIDGPVKREAPPVERPAPNAMRLAAVGVRVRVVSLKPPPHSPAE